MRISNSTTANDLTIVSRMSFKNMILKKMSKRKMSVINIMLICFLGVSGYSQGPCDGMKCITNVNLSLDENCSSTITPGMFVQNLNFPPEDYVIEVYDAHGNQVDSIFGIEDVNETFEVKVFLPACGNNFCWSYMTVEYKLPPALDCPDDLTISCGGLDVLGLPTAVEACGGLNFTVTLHNEIRERLDCDPDYTHRIERTYRATDEMGNFDECSHEIFLERISLDDIMFPENRSVGGLNPISCNDPAYLYNEDGIPLPWLFSEVVPDMGGGFTGSGTNMGGGFTGSGTSGVPFICDNSIVNGVYCPLTGSGSGAPIIPMGGATSIGPDGLPFIVPGEVNQVCNSAVTYSDIELPQAGCVRKIMRTWEVREWWCNGENSRSSVQLIEIIDDEAPVFECPPSLTITTNDYCAASVELPPVDAEDACDNGIRVAIDYPNGYLNANGGLVDLEVGDNIVDYIVSDDCYNSSSCRVSVLVRDDTEPVSICEQSTVVAISQSGTTLVFAETFDDGSWDECGLDRFEVRRMDTICIAADTLFDSSISFCCSDVGTEVMIVFRAYDLGGNYNECMVRVEVQDKDIPLMTCPQDVTIDCRVPFDLENLDLVFGDEDVIDNCAAQQVVVEIVTSNVNTCGIGEIIREFQLRSLDSTQVLRSCKQRISVENFTPFVEVNIQWPLNYDTLGPCNYDLGPDELPELYAYPKFLAGDDECSLLGWDFEDRLFESRDGFGACAHIERTWSVINWCSQINGSFEVFTMNPPQIIEIFNDVYPSIDPADDVTVESLNIDCESGLIEVSRTATDDCEEFYWSYEVRDDQMNLVAVGDSSSYIDTIINGEYVITWVVTDRCGNINTDEQALTVINKKAPIPICINGFTVSLEEEVQMGDTTYVATLWANDFDGGSYHPCGNPITFSLDSDTMINNRVFDCSDIGPQGVRMWVTDVVTGVQDFCSTTIEVLDNPDCPDMNRADVAGEIYTEELEEVEGVSVELDGGDLFDMTTNSGRYAFNNMPLGGNYTVIPKKDGDDLNGVSTLDLILIQRHILGIQSLNSPYKLIAADIDKNDKISALDLIELRKLVLGIYEEIPNNSSWRFIDAAATFVDPQDPWAFNIPEEYEIWNLEQNMDLDFVGVKIGDVNNTVIANEKSISEGDLNEEESIVLDFPKLSAKAGEYKVVELYSSNYKNIAGWQGTIAFDPQMVEVIGIQNAGMTLVDNENVNLNSADQGWITLSYSNAIAESFENDETLLRIELIAKRDINSNEIFELNSQVTKAEAYLKDNKVVPIKISVEETGELVITKVMPNPWVDNATIHFDLPYQDNIRFEFYDVNGRLLHVKERHYNSGSNMLVIQKSELQTSGVIYMRMSNNYGHSEYKMLVIE